MESLPLLVFDLWGNYAHYKKIYATTTAVTYPIPTKTALYGMVGAFLGLQKEDYLASFPAGECLISIQPLAPLQTRKVHINLHADYHGIVPENGNRKPTLMEMVYQPRYRIYFYHRDASLMDALAKALQERSPIFTPTLGIANLLANYELVERTTGEPKQGKGTYVPLTGTVAARNFLSLPPPSMQIVGEQLMELSMYPIQMDMERQVTDRDDIFLERQGKKITLEVEQYYTLSDGTHITLF